MPTPLRLLIVEENATDVAAVLEEVRRAGFEPRWKHVDTRAGFIEALSAEYDLVVSGFGTEEFKGLEALELLQAGRPGTPFILVSGSIGEEQAREFVRKGAVDCVPKDHLDRLGRGILRAQREQEAERARLRAEEALRSSEDGYRALLETVRNEAQSHWAQRMAGLGILAEGIAHDLNNIIAPITLAAQVLQLQHQDRETQTLLATIESSAQRGAEIVRQVLTFGQGLEGDRLLIQPRHLLKEMARVAKETFPKTIRIHRKLPEDLWTVAGDPAELRQVLHNLCVHAREAMAGGGSLWLTAENLTLTDQEANQTPAARPGRYVVLQVTDTGAGRPAAILDRLFEPNSSTGEQGEGANLGLSSALGIVRGHHGFIKVQSELGKGTTVKVFIPAAPAPQATPPPELARPAIPRGHSETVLVVDDDPGIRNLIRGLLIRHGYEALAAEDGTEAVAMIALRREGIQLVVTDVVMPFMDGVELVRALRKIAPELKVIAMSGMAGVFEEGERAGELRKLNVQEFLPKPFAAARLLQAVHRVLHPNLTNL